MVGKYRAYYLPQSNHNHVTHSHVINFRFRSINLFSSQVTSDFVCNNSQEHLKRFAFMLLVSSVISDKENIYNWKKKKR